MEAFGPGAMYTKIYPLTRLSKALTSFRTEARHVQLQTAKSDSHVLLHPFQMLNSPESCLNSQKQAIRSTGLDSFKSIIIQAMKAFSASPAQPFVVTKHFAQRTQHLRRQNSVGRSKSLTPGHQIVPVSSENNQMYQDFQNLLIEMEIE